MGFGDFVGGLAKTLTGGDILSGALQIGGGIANAISGNKAQEREYGRQKEFAQNGIRWRVDDAKAAGIHPIFAVGANTPTYSPQVATGTDYGLSQVGQNISRAIEAKQTREERLANAVVTRDVGAAQANYYNAAARNQDAQALLAENKLVSPTDSMRDFTISQAVNSGLALRNQPGQPPAMPKTNESPNPGFEGDQPSWVRFIDEEGRIAAILPSGMVHDRVEDIHTLENIPYVAAFLKAAKQRGEIAGHHLGKDGYWHEGYRVNYDKNRQSARGRITRAVFHDTNLRTIRRLR